MSGPFTVPVAESVPFENSNSPFYGKELQTTTEELRNEVTFKKVEVLTDGSITLLTIHSPTYQVAYGSASGHGFQLPNATLCFEGRKFELMNLSSRPIKLYNGSGLVLIDIAPSSVAYITLRFNTTIGGEWVVFIANAADINLNNPNFSGVKDGFEDFMFDAYAGNGGNDNQYAFTAVANGGTSDIDGAISAVGNDYEGIHILSSGTSATAGPLVHAFNGVNRIKLGYHSESFEVRVRIEELSTLLQSFTARYGLMDVITPGLPANGIFFSYVPTNYVAPVKQVVTVTPNSLPVATFQVININPTRANNTLYTVTINGTVCSYTSDATATDLEIANGLIAAINSSAQSSKVNATLNTTDIRVTSKILGEAFTYSGSASNVITLIMANVPIAIYEQIINGIIYSFTSDGTPTATEVVTGLKNLIDNDLSSQVVASGTTTLILTSKVAGTAFTYSGSANLTEVLTTANVVEVPYVGNWLIGVINSSSVTYLDSNIPIVAGQFYKLKCVIAANGMETFIYIDDFFVGKISAAIPTAALRFVFKLEKQTGTTARTTSIDYITWRRNR